MGFVILLLLSINPERTRKGHHHQADFIEPTNWMARSSIGTKFERFNYAPKNAISIANCCTSCFRTHSSRAQRSSFLPLQKKYTSTVRRVVMCVGDKGTVCRHLDEYYVYCMLHPVIVLLAPSLSCSHELRAKGYTSLDIRSERESNPAILGHQLHQRRLNYCFRGT